MRNIKQILLGSAATVALLCACGQQPAPVAPELTKSGINPADYDTVIAVAYDYENRQFVPDTANAKPVSLYTLTNKNGMEVCITNFGGRIVSIMVPDKEGKFVDVACGFDKVENYFPWNFETDFGCSVGRYANRIDGGQFTLPGQDEPVVLDKNNNGFHSLHGGYTGWQYQVYDVVEANENSLTLKRISPDGDNKFPGNVEAVVKFELTDNNEIVINYDATTDAPTIINMTNHTYFNLSGDFNNTIDESILTVNADAYTPGDDNLIPTGEIRPVEGTVFDFRTPLRCMTHAVESNLRCTLTNLVYSVTLQTSRTEHVRVRVASCIRSIVLSVLRVRNIQTLLTSTNCSDGNSQMLSSLLRNHTTAIVNMLSQSRNKERILKKIINNLNYKLLKN